MHAWHVLAFVLFTAAAVLAVAEKAWTLALLAAGSAAFMLPAAFQLTSS